MFRPMAEVAEEAEEMEVLIRLELLQRPRNVLLHLFLSPHPRLRTEG